jgi:uncharacterized protein
MRALMWLLLGVLVIFALRKKNQRPSDSVNSAQMQPGQSSNIDNANAETMLCCERCQVYFPASEAVMRGEKVFCCAAHADQP